MCANIKIKTCFNNNFTVGRATEHQQSQDIKKKNKENQPALSSSSRQDKYKTDGKENIHNLRLNFFLSGPMENNIRAPCIQGSGVLDRIMERSIGVEWWQLLEC